jgi:hypothetical protein
MHMVIHSQCGQRWGVFRAALPDKKQIAIAVRVVAENAGGG